MPTHGKPNSSGIEVMETQATTPDLRKLSASEIDAVSGGLGTANANPLVVCKYPADGNLF